METMKLRQLSIGTFNLYNLNEPDLPIYTGRGWTQAEYDLKIDWTNVLSASCIQTSSASRNCGMPLPSRVHSKLRD